MAVRLRLTRLGRRHRPFYRIAAMDARTRRDGPVVEELGHYDPVAKKAEDQVRLKEDRVAYWLSVGALPTDTVRRLLDKHMGKQTSGATA